MRKVHTKIHINTKNIKSQVNIFKETSINKRMLIQL